MQSLQDVMRSLADNLDWVETIDEVDPQDAARVMAIRTQMLSVAERLLRIAQELPKK